MSPPDKQNIFVQLGDRLVASSDDTKAILEDLDAIAVILRDENERLLAPTTLADDLVALMRTERWQIIGGCARVAANLAADNDTGRTQLVEAGYLDIVLRILTGCPQEYEKALVASLLNMSVNGHEPTCRLLAQSLPVLFEFLAQRTGDAWLWQIVAATSEQDPSLFCMAFRPEYAAHLEAALRSSEEDIVVNAGLIVEKLCEAEAPPTKLPLGAILAFVEQTVGPSASKACLIRGLVALSPQTMQKDFMWSTMEHWLSGREDQIACALLCLGNAINDSVALRIVGSLLPTLLLVDTSTPAVHHALLGLLRNLSVPKATRVALGNAGVLEYLVQTGVWREKYDLLGSVQGSAVVVVKNLCREACNATRFVESIPGVEQLLLLRARSDDPALKLEIARVFSNIIRHRYDRMQDDRILDALVEMLRAGARFPILLHESVVAMAVLAAFVPLIRPTLLAKLQTDEDGVVPLTQLARLADSEHQAELKENVSKLLKCIDPKVADL